MVKYSHVIGAEENRSCFFVREGETYEGHGEVFKNCQKQIGVPFKTVMLILDPFPP